MSTKDNSRPQLEKILRERIVIIDGAMGTTIRTYGLGEAEIRGERFKDFAYPLKGNNEALVAYLKKEAKIYYNQVQHQLFVSELEECNFCYLSCQSYDDQFNYKYQITNIKK